MSAAESEPVRLDRGAEIVATVEHLLRYVDDPADREALRRIGQRAIVSGGEP